MKGRVNIDKLTSFLEDLRMSKNRTVSLGALMCASDASAADTKHVAEVRCFLHEGVASDSFIYCSKRFAQLYTVITSSCPTSLCGFHASWHCCMTVLAAFLKHMLFILIILLGCQNEMGTLPHKLNDSVIFSKCTG